MKKMLGFIQEYSVPLILGIVIALVWANANYESYHHFLDAPFLGDGVKILGHTVNFHFLINDIFMVFFFGIAGVEIMQAVGPGGALNPPSKAINPLMGTLGGVLGPIGIFFLFVMLVPMDNVMQDGVTIEAIRNGWGIPTATDIALAWLVARLVFGAKHPAVSYLLLLAVADDAIGLGIIAVAYPDPNHPVAIGMLGFTALGMALSFGLNKMKVQNMWLYLVIGGGLSWYGLIQAHLHPALALVFIVPFMPTLVPKSDGHAEGGHHAHSTLVSFEHTFKGMVDFGLLGFGLANAGVLMGNINEVTWLILAALIVGKTLGITFFGYVAHLCGAKLPQGMGLGTLVLAGLIAALGLTVALFVAGEAYADVGLQGAAKMGALLSVVAGILAIVIGMVCRVKKIH